MDQPDGQNKSSIGCFLVIGILAALGIFVLILFFAALGEIRKYLGENVSQTTRIATVGGSESGDSVDCSNVANVKAEYLVYVKDAAAKWIGGDEAALIALIQIESGWNPQAKNPGSSAAGLGQFLTSTARGMKEFVGGNDGKGTVWSPGRVDSSISSDDARFEPKRSIYASAHLFGNNVKKYGNVGDAYAYAYHGGLRLGGKYAEEALKGKARLERVYNALKSGGGCSKSSPTSS